MWHDGKITDDELEGTAVGQPPERVEDGWLIIEYPGNPPIRLDILIVDRVVADDDVVVITVSDVTLSFRVSGGIDAARTLASAIAPFTRSKPIDDHHVYVSTSRRLHMLRECTGSPASLYFGDCAVIVENGAVRVARLSWWLSDLEPFAAAGTTFALPGGSMQAAWVFLVAARENRDEARTLAARVAEYEMRHGGS